MGAGSVCLPVWLAVCLQCLTLHNLLPEHKQAAIYSKAGADLKATLQEGHSKAPLFGRDWQIVQVVQSWHGSNEHLPVCPAAIMQSNIGIRS